MTSSCYLTLLFPPADKSSSMESSFSLSGEQVHMYVHLRRGVTVMCWNYVTGCLQINRRVKEETVNGDRKQMNCSD